MKPGERDDLLIRIDERVKALKDGDEGAIPDMIKHLATLNGRVGRNSNDIKWLKRIVGGVTATGAAIAAILKGIGM